MIVVISVWISTMRPLEVWVYLIVLTTLLLAGFLSAMVGIAIDSILLIIAGIGVLGTGFALAPKGRRYETSYILFAAGGLLYGSLIVPAVLIAHEEFGKGSMGLAFSPVGIYAMHTQARKLKYYPLPRFLDWMRRKVTVEQQLEDLAACGIHLKRKFTVEDLLKECDRRMFELYPYDDLIFALGGYFPEPPYSAFSNDVWTFDHECIEDTGAYADIARRHRKLAKGDLPLTEIEDHVDLDTGTAWLAFTLDGKRYKWDAEVENDWVDVEILTKLHELLDERCTGRRFYSLLIGGQAQPILCLTSDQANRLHSLGVELLPDPTWHS